MKINSYLDEISERYLYLLELDLTTHNLKHFGNIRYVVMQGSNERALDLAKKLAKNFMGIHANYFIPQNLVTTSRYCIYRVDNILSVSHGMGNTSMFTFLHEITKVLHYAGNQNFEYIRIGTSGGIGVNPGTVILTEHSYMPNLMPYLELPSLDTTINIPTPFDLNLSKLIYKCQPDNLNFEIKIAKTIAADDFYLGQGRIDGALIPKYDLDFRNKYFKKIYDLGIRNFEMESTALAAFCYFTEIPAAMIAVTLINRMLGDQITISTDELHTYSDHAQIVALNYLTKCQNIL